MNNRKNDNGNGKFFILALLLLVIGVSIGYAALSKTLNINGTSNIANNAKWDIHLTNVQVTPGSANASKAAVIEGDTVSFSVDLNTPGDYYEFTVDVTNAGTIDAKLGSTPELPTLTAEQQKYVTYITWDDEWINVSDPQKTEKIVEILKNKYKNVYILSINETNIPSNAQFLYSTKGQLIEDSIYVREEIYSIYEIG